MPVDYCLSCLRNIKLQKNITFARGMIPALWLFIFKPHPNVGCGGTTEYSTCYQNTDENRLGHQNKWFIYWSERWCQLFSRKSQERKLMTDVLLLMQVCFSISYMYLCQFSLYQLVNSSGLCTMRCVNPPLLDKLSRYSKLHFHLVQTFAEHR